MCTLGKWKKGEKVVYFKGRLKFLFISTEILFHIKVNIVYSICYHFSKTELTYHQPYVTKKI